MNADLQIAELSVRQGGAVRTEQALACGLTRDQVRYRVRSGRWLRLGKGAYLVTPMTTVEDHLRAAISSLPRAVVAHEAAAELHDLAYVERGLASVLVHSQTTHEFPGVIVRRCHDLMDDHVDSIRDMPVTSIARTIVDLAAIISARNLEAVLDDAVAARRVPIAAVADVAAAVGRSGKPGTRKLRAVLEARLGPEYDGTALERKGNALLLTIDGSRPLFEYPIPWRAEHRFDAAYPDAQLGIEWDSKRWHTQVAAFNRDRERDRDAVVHGWRVLRFTWQDITERPDVVIATVKSALELASHA